jgi:hypothetical protein
MDQQLLFRREASFDGCQCDKAVPRLLSYRRPGP